MRHREIDPKTGKEVIFERRKLLINPEFQLSFLTYILGIAIFTLVIFYVAKVVFFSQVQDYLVSMGLPADHLVFDFLAKQSRAMDLIFGAASIIEVAFLALVGLKLSHRVAGPLFRLKQDFLSVAGGAPPKKIRFRKGDYFQEVADAYNLHLERIQPGGAKDHSAATVSGPKA